jgi:hypothetical protein
MSKLRLKSKKLPKKKKMKHAKRVVGLSVMRPLRLFPSAKMGTRFTSTSD